MKQLAILIFVCVACVSCAHKVYENTSEYRKDSISTTEKTNRTVDNAESIRYVYIHDSVNIQSKGDTVYIYKSKFVKDYSAERKLRIEVDSLKSIIDNFELRRDTVIINNTNTPAANGNNAVQKICILAVNMILIMLVFIISLKLKARFF